MIIKSAAYFDLCEVCSLHGRVVIPGSLPRKLVFSQDAAIVDMMAASTEHLLLPDEEEVLLWMIRRSGLPKVASGDSWRDLVDVLHMSGQPGFLLFH